MKKQSAVRRPSSGNARLPALRKCRNGMTQLEVVITTAVAFPLAVALFLMGVKVFIYMYKITSALVGWPYM